MNRKERRAASKQARRNTAGTVSTKSKRSSYLFPLALNHYQKGQGTEAEKICRQVLLSEPNHADAFHLLGIIAHQAGRQQVAIDLISKALALNPRNQTFHYNIGLALQSLGRAKDAIDHYEHAITLQPDWTGALMALGNAFFQQGRLSEATDKYQRVLDIEPSFVEAIYMLGNALQMQGRLEQATAYYQQALVLRPDFAEVYNNLGNAFRQQGKLDEAVNHCRRSLTIKADNPEALNNLALALQQKGAIDEALDCYQQALALRPEFFEVHQNCCLLLMSTRDVDRALSHARRALEIRESPDAKALFIQCVRSVTDPASIPMKDELRRQVIRALVEPWTRPGDLLSVSIGLIKTDNEIKKCLELARCPASLVANAAHLAAASKNELLRCLLEASPVSDLELERMLIAIRSGMLELATTATASHRLENSALNFYCALARQCFINEYIFVCSDAELDRARELCDALIAAMESGRPFPEIWIAATAAYVPLHSLPLANSLLKLTFSDPVMQLVAQQVLEPHQEKAYRISIPRLTEIDDAVSRLVQQQYEESPYPRWIRTAPLGEPSTVSRYLHQLCPGASLAHLEGSREIEILIAGCGTGQQSIETAQKFPGARIHAIDLSLASLCYAKRKTCELGLKNIEYAQADILQLRNVGRTYDVIEATGVLHHLANPMAGWRTLLSVLRPGGVMRVGIYSKLARKNISAARAFVLQHGYVASDSDIRRCRRELAELDDKAIFRDLTATADFYSISGCRDLLFNVQEHQMTLPEIDRFLTENDLRFLAFGIDSWILTQFRERFPGEAVNDLKLWHVFEMENPMTFVRMYQFWTQKNGSN